MPDISKLPELAELFGVTIDQILGESSKTLESAVKGNMKERFENNTVTIEEIKNIAPILKPHQVEEIVESDKFGDLEEIEDLLPFIGQDVVNKIALKMADNREYHKLDIVIPFVSKSILSELAEKIYAQKGVTAIEDIAPFLLSDQLIRIAEKEYQNHGLRHFDSIAPFLNRKYLNELAQKAIQKDGIKAISNIAPFLDKGMLAEYVKDKYL